MSSVGASKAGCMGRSSGCAVAALRNLQEISQSLEVITWPKDLPAAPVIPMALPSAPLTSTAPPFSLTVLKTLLVLDLASLAFLPVPRAIGQVRCPPPWASQFAELQANFHAYLPQPHSSHWLR